MSEEIITAIVYTLLDEKIGPKPFLWDPIDLPDNISMPVGIKSITMLSTDQGVIPQSLVIIPFPMLNLKGITKYIERADESRRGGAAVSTITLLFKEAYDLIFYKYIDYLESAFSESAQKIIDLENNQAKSDDIYTEINELKNRVSEILDDLSNKEKSTSELEAFPEDKKIEERKLGYNYKIIICGDPSVGKTSTILRFTDHAFIRTYIPTLGVSISEKNIKVNNDYVNLILWDIAGQSKFEIMRRHFYKGSEAVILIFDLTNLKSFESIPNWYNDVIKNLKMQNEELIGFILGNKEDLLDERKVSVEQANEIAKKLNLEYLETSALTGKNVEESFYKLAKALIKSKQ
ncbi:MAG: GTP-binding protein [Candidatus Lokiarchaeota archaeon]|nr:GTP-binding protein [Candidatus Lokiarchaeota archaeon]